MGPQHRRHDQACILFEFIANAPNLAVHTLGPLCRNKNAWPIEMAIGALFPMLVGILSVTMPPTTRVYKRARIQLSNHN